MRLAPKAVAETALEDAAFVLARALAIHFKKSGDLDRHGKVDVTKSEIMKLRTQELVNKTTAIRDLGTAAITAFSAVMSTPRGQIVNRSALLKEVETDVAALLEKVGDMDDLVVQFDGSDAGKRFIEARKRARIIVDSGGGGGTAPTPPTPPAPPPAQGQFQKTRAGSGKEGRFFMRSICNRCRKASRHDDGNNSIQLA